MQDPAGSFASPDGELTLVACKASLTLLRPPALRVQADSAPPGAELCARGGPSGAASEQWDGDAPGDSLPCLLCYSGPISSPLAECPARPGTDLLLWLQRPPALRGLCPPSHPPHGRALLASISSPFRTSPRVPSGSHICRCLPLPLPAANTTHSPPFTGPSQHPSVYKATYLQGLASCLHHACGGLTWLPLRPRAWTRGSVSRQERSGAQPTTGHHFPVKVATLCWQQWQSLAGECLWCLLLVTACTS